MENLFQFVPLAFLSDASGHSKLFLTLFVMYVAAKLMAEIFERLKQPAVAGEILAGILIGPSVLGLVAPSAFTDALAEIGVIFLLFLVGLETKPSDIFRVGARATVVAVLGVIVPFVAGWGLAWLWEIHKSKPFLSALRWWQLRWELLRVCWGKWDY